MLCDAPVRPEPRDAPVLQSAQMGGQPVPVHRGHHLALLFAHHGVGSYIAVLDLVEFPYATPALDWDLGMVYLVFPLSFLLMAIRIVQVNVIKYILKEDDS